VEILCELMRVSRSGYYKYLHVLPTQKNHQKERLLIEVKGLSKESDNSYGSRRISKGLKEKGYKIGRYAARTLMREAGINCKQRRRYRIITTQSKHTFAVADNILNRIFTAIAPNRVWLTDITYLWTLEGWLYIAAVLDVFSRRIVGWAMADHMREELVQEALQMALGRRQPVSGLLHHSDRGVQYAANNYQSMLKAAGITVSMSRKGNCWDNAVMERFWGSLKSERTDEKIYNTREEAKADVIDYIEMFYNCKRLHSFLGYVSPMQFENEFLLNNLSTFT
jgi:putative transposase